LDPAGFPLPLVAQGHAVDVVGDALQIRLDADDEPMWPP
jgi:hypothetical protein